MKKLLLLLSILAMSSIISAQMPGVIIKDAGTGAAILDPDEDGYISTKTNGEQIGFTSTPNNDFTQSEIPFTPIVYGDISDDVIQGPGCKFTELVGDSASAEYTAFAYFDGSNLIFRIRIADISPNSIGYSILIDTDQKFGSTGENADPNALDENKGFEVEIALITKNGVNVYKVDGSITPELMAENSYDNFAQKSMAGSVFCGKNNYFYDFYIPFSQLSDIPGLNISHTTPFRFAVVTNIAPKPSIGSLSISDIGDCSSLETFDTQALEVINTRTTIVIGDLGDEDNIECPSISENCTTDTTTWTGVISNDWADDNNWSNLQPTICSHVVIPALNKEIHYPIIMCPAACSTISFKAKSAVMGLNLLTYEKAYVEVDMKRSAWLPISAPLKNMYAGDYYFQGAPVSYSKYFSKIDADALYYPGRNTGMWNTKIDEQNMPLDNGQGYFGYIATKTFHYPNPIVYETEDFLIEFPRRNPDGSLLSVVYPYLSSTGMLYTDSPIELPRDTTTSYRFAMENDSNKLSNGKIAINQGLNMLTNPYMSHIDFEALYASNADKISNKIKYWNGETFTTYTAGDRILSNKDFPETTIAPMQGFFLEGLVDDSINIDLIANFTADLSLNSTADTTKTLHIKSDNGSKKSSTAIALRTNASNQLDEKDAFKLFSQYTDVPEIFTVVEEVNLDINQFNSLPYMAPIGIYSELSGNISLSFEGADSFENIDVILINTNTGEQQDLKTNSQYTLPYQGESEVDGYLFVELRASEITTNVEEENFCKEYIRVFQKDINVIGIVSRPSDKIKNITIWEQSGILLYHSNKVNRSLLDVKVNAKNKTCIVRVRTENSSYVVKILMQE